MLHYMKLTILKPIFLVLGLIFLALGSIGVVVPVLPTTPFLLLASYCLLRGSTRFHHWFSQTKLYKNHLENFLLTRSMTFKTKIRIVTFATIMLAITFWRIDIWYARIMLILSLLFLAYYFTYQIKTIE